MSMKHKMMSLFVVSILALSIVSFTPIRFWSVKAQLGAAFTGVISDRGVDIDADGQFDYLEVAVEVNVFDCGYYSVEVNALQDLGNSSLSVSVSDSGYFNAGTGLFNLSFFGPAINKAHFSPAFLYNMRLSQSWGSPLEERFHVPLSRSYSYSDFDCRALLTGNMYDEGVDTDGDGLFNYLQIGVEVNVTDASTYEVRIDQSTFVYPPISNYTRETLLPGLQVVNVSLNGPMIRALKVNPSSVNHIGLQDLSYGLDDRYYVPLSKTYNYTDFDTLAFFTGIIADRAVDTDGDSKFEYLEVSVQVNVTEAGYYSFSASGLSENSTWGVYISDYRFDNLGAGLHSVNFTFPSQLIYSSKVNPAYLSNVQLSTSIGWYWMTIDQLDSAPLSRNYQYNDFDPHAYLTGTIYDKGVDTDHDGLLDYLETSIEVNVTEAGTYSVSVYGLAESAGNESKQLYDYQNSESLELDTGVHLFNFTFYGPHIAYDEINPRNVTGLNLKEMPDPWSQWGQDIGYIATTPLTKQYYFNQFNHPFKDMRFKFTVFPDGHVAIDATQNNTHMYPRNEYGPVFNASARFSKMNNSILGLVNGSCAIPPYVTVPWPYPYYSTQFPTDSATADFAGEYNNGILNAELNATTTFPPIVKTLYPFNTTDFTLSGTYSDGMMHARLNGFSIMPSFWASQLPFNVTDTTVLANFGNNQFRGNITLHTIAGLPAGDIKVDFEGDRSGMLFTGYVNVVYGTYYGNVVNATVVSKLISDLKSTIPGKGENSLYSATEGILECTQLETQNTTIPGGVRVDYTVTIHGDFAGLIANYLTHSFFYYPTQQEHDVTYAALNATLSSVDNLSMTMVYTYAQKLAQVDLSFDSNLKTLWSNALQLIPPIISSGTPEYVKDQVNAILKLANSTAYAVQNAWLYASYSTTAPQPTLDLRMGLTANVTQIKDDAVQVILNLTYPIEVRNIMKSYLNTTYATLDSCNTTIHLENGVADFKTDFTFEGDFKTQLNNAKSCYFSILNMTSPYQYDWQMRLLNRTDIDISNLKLNLQLGRNNTVVELKELMIYPQKQTVSNIAFKLWDLFDTNAFSYESPRKYEKVKITVQGGSDAAHTILPFLPSRPPTVPPPNNVSPDGKTFTWENTTMASLRELIFNVAFQGSFTYGGTTYYVPILSNSTVNDFSFDLTGILSFSIDGPTGTGGFCNITLPRALLDVNNPSEWVILKDGSPIPQAQYNITQNSDYTFIYITYTHSSHTIVVEGTLPVREISPNVLSLLIVMTTMIVIALTITQRKKLRTFKLKGQQIAHHMANRLSRHLHQ